jgi:phenylpyruvate tautomerase PptA (4-oxalocrotonate tautomerase family)
MPVYQCTTPAARLGDAQRQEIAGEITRIHCDCTGAPPEFAHVLFMKAPEGAGVSVLGTIRAGRPAALRARMAGAIAEAVAKAVGAEAGSVRVHLLEVPASWVMEGGALLPEPGDEADWLAQHAQR